MTPLNEERMMNGAMRQQVDVLDADDRCLERDLTTVLNSADIFWSGTSEAERAELLDEVHRFEGALEAVGVLSTPRLRYSIGQALREGGNQALTLKLDAAQFTEIQSALSEMVLELTSWRSGVPPGSVFNAAKSGTEATVEDAAKNLCLMFVPRDRLSGEQRVRTYQVLHFVAPRLSAEGLETLEDGLRHLELKETFDAALRPGFTEAARIGVLPLWPDASRPRQVWVISSDASWVLVSSHQTVTSEDASRIVSQMAFRWERASFPEHGAALTSILVEVAIESAARRSQELGRAAEAVFSLDNAREIRVALDRLAKELAELNTGLGELDVAAAGAHADLERKGALTTNSGSHAHLYGFLHSSLDEELAKLDRQMQRLQGSFLAAREHASSYHVAGTINELRRQQESISKNQQATDNLNRIVGRLTIMLLGPTIVFGALSVNNAWIYTKNLVVSAGLLLVYVFLGLGVSLFIRDQIGLFTRLFSPRVSSSTTTQPEAVVDADPAIQEGTSRPVGSKT
jgi:hypothetical protein